MMRRVPRAEPADKPEPARVQDLERDAEALAHVAEPVLDRHAHVLEEHGARVATP